MNRVKSVVLLLFLSLLFNNCDNRECECGDDLAFIWKDGFQLENLDIVVPNAVLNVGLPLSINLYRFNQDENYILDWELKKVKIYKGDNIFVDTESTSSFIKNNKLIEIPHDVFNDSSPDLIKGPVSINLQLQFSENKAIVNIVGSIYFYDCKDFSEEFNAEECRWPSQVIGEFYLSPC